MKGVKLSCKRRRELYILYKNTNNLQVKIITNYTVQF